MHRISNAEGVSRAPPSPYPNCAIAIRNADDVFRKGVSNCENDGLGIVTVIRVACAQGAGSGWLFQEKLIGKHDADWPDWYADYIVKEQAGQPLPS